MRSESDQIHKSLNVPNLPYSNYMYHIKNFVNKRQDVMFMIKSTVIQIKAHSKDLSIMKRIMNYCRRIILVRQVNVKLTFYL
jgi:hypothetical protein